MSTATARPAYIVFDIETVPDGALLARVRYPEEDLTPEQAIERAQEEERQRSNGTSDFVPWSFQIPVAVCMAPVGADFRLQGLHVLDEPHYRTAAQVRTFWKLVNHHSQARLVTFNGRCFDLPVMELSAFRYGVSAVGSFGEARKRYGERHIDLLELLTNYGAVRLAGGLDLLSKILGKPGKVETKGHQVYDLYRRGKLAEINAYCCFDVLDTYFVFLRTRVLVGALPLDAEQVIVRETRQWLEEEARKRPALRPYLDAWGDWKPWP